MKQLGTVWGKTSFRHSGKRFGTVWEQVLDIAGNGSGRFGTVSKTNLETGGSGSKRFRTISKHVFRNSEKRFGTVEDYF